MELSVEHPGPTSFSGVLLVSGTCKNDLPFLLAPFVIHLSVPGKIGCATKLAQRSHQFHLTKSSVRVLRKAVSFPPKDCG
jgi:hypothetical protein